MIINVLSLVVALQFKKKKTKLCITPTKISADSWMCPGWDMENFWYASLGDDLVKSETGPWTWKGRRDPRKRLIGASYMEFYLRKSPDISSFIYSVPLVKTYDMPWDGHHRRYKVNETHFSLTKNLQTRLDTSGTYKYTNKQNKCE